MAQLVNAVEYMQTKGIMHRDLKPGNIMLDEMWNLKIIDYGDAKKVEEEEEEKMERTVAGSFCGTLNYISPEVFQNGDQGFSIDTWALGNILFKLFTGRVPFQGQDQMQIQADVVQRNINWPKNMTINPDAVDLINRMI